MLFQLNAMIAVNGLVSVLADVRRFVRMTDIHAEMRTWREHLRKCREEDEELEE